MVCASALVIGDEILTGKVQDANSVVLARMLFDRGVPLLRIEVVPDQVDEMISCLRRLSKTHDYVFTSGGIGPTHDDRTYEAVSKAFDRPLAYHQATLNTLKERPGSESRFKMALLPQPCEILSTPGLWVPLVVVENVYVLPGIPSMFAHMINGIKDRFSGPPIERVLLYSPKPESEIALELEAVQNTYPRVAIGSYPKDGVGEYRVMVSLEGTDRKAVLEAADQVRCLL